MVGADAVKEKNLTLHRYQDLDLGVLEDGLYARSADLKDPVRVETFKRFLSAAARGWQSLHDDPSDAERLLMVVAGRSQAG